MATSELRPQTSHAERMRAARLSATSGVRLRSPRNAAKVRLKDAAISVTPEASSKRSHGQEAGRNRGVLVGGGRSWVL